MAARALHEAAERSKPVRGRPFQKGADSRRNAGGMRADQRATLDATRAAGLVHGQRIRCDGRGEITAALDKLVEIIHDSKTVPATVVQAVIAYAALVGLKHSERIEVTADLALAIRRHTVGQDADGNG